MKEYRIIDLNSFETYERPYMPFWVDFSFLFFTLFNNPLIGVTNMKLKPLLLLASSVLLVSCADANNHVDSLIGSTASEGTVTTSSGQVSSEPSSISVPDGYPTAWTENDLEEMAEYIGENVIPFPLGITSNYETDTDTYGEAFLVYDADCGNLCDAYCGLLVSDGYVYSEYDSNEDENYFTYYKNLDDGSDLFVQTDYTDGYFEVFAWIEVPVETYSSFPYEAINESLGTNLDETNFPSFEVAEGENYYVSVYEGSYLLVYGYLDSSVSDSDFDEDYLGAFEDMGFTLDDDYYGASSEDLGVEAFWYAEEGLASVYIYTLEAE